jgi:hypothetical protein
MKAICFPSADQAGLMATSHATPWTRRTPVPSTLMTLIPSLAPTPQP